MSEDKKYKKFEALNVSSKYAICGLPIRVDTYKTCSFGCKYCFSNCRKVMEFEKELAVANLKSVERRLKRIITDKNIKNGDFLDMLIAQDYTWHMGGMSDPFQPVEEKLQITKGLLDGSIRTVTVGGRQMKAEEFLMQDAYNIQRDLFNRDTYQVITNEAEAMMEQRRNDVQQMGGM